MIAFVGLNQMLEAAWIDRGIICLRKNGSVHRLLSFCRTSIVDQVQDVAGNKSVIVEVHLFA